MKKSSFLSMVFSALLAATLVVSCDTGGGGGGGGGGSSAPSSTDIKIIIGSDSSSSDILGDFGAEASDYFYYEVSFTGGGKTYPPKGGIKGTQITFLNVPFGTYEFNLDIYSDSTKSIKVGTETATKDIQQAQNTVEFDLRYSKYQNIYFVSNAASFIKALTGRNKDGVPIDTSNMKEDDESTWVRVYVNESFTLEGTGNALKSDTPHYVKVFMNGNTITTNYSGGYGLRLEDKITASFENGNIITPWVQVDAATASLTLDNVELTQKDTAVGNFMNFSSGNVSIKNGCNISAITNYPNVSVSEGCTVTIEDSTIEHPNGEAISMSGGEVTLSGTTVTSSCEAEATTCVNVLGGTLSVTDGSKISAEGVGLAINLSDGTLNVSDSIIEAKDAYALYLGGEDNPVANITDSIVTSDNDAICVVCAELNLKNTTVTTTGTGNYYGIRVSGSDDSHAFVKMDGGEVKALGSSYPAVYVRSYENAYDECKFILTGDGRITGNSSGLEMEGGTFVMLGGEIETASSDANAVELSNCVFAMTDSYAGTTTTLTNRVNKIYCDSSLWDSICILMGGNSQADVVDVNSCGVIFAQVSNISGVPTFVNGITNVVSAFGGGSTTTLAIADSALSLPSGFEYTATVEDNDDYFCIQDSDTYVWQPNTVFDDELFYWSVTDRDP